MVPRFFAAAESGIRFKIIRSSLAVSSLYQHDQEIDQRPSGDCGRKGEEEQLDRFVSFVFDHHFRDHLAKGATGAGQG